MAAPLDFLGLHPFVRAAAHDRVLGTIVGSALGDTIGLFTEFLPRAEALRTYPDQTFSLLKPTEFREDSHRDKFEPRAWTDDTDHALLILLSYLHNKGEILPNDFASRLQTWCRQGLRCLDRLPLGLGQTVGRVALDPEYVADPFAIALRTWRDGGRRGAANGSLMRTHPLGVMCVGRSLQDTFQVAADMSRVTHVDPRCVLACCVATALVRGLLRGEVLTEADVDALMEEARKWVDEREEMRDPGREKEKTGAEAQQDDTDSEAEKGGLDVAEFEKHVQATSFGELQLDDSYKMGYVYKCLGVAILALRIALRADPTDMHTFERIITEIAMAGGDADTNACAAGALLGALLGYSRLPYDWREGLQHRDWLVQKSIALSQVAGISKGGDVKAISEDPDTALDGGRGMLTRDQTDQRERDLIFMMLNKQKERREAEEKKKKQTFGKWVAGVVGSK